MLRIRNLNKIYAGKVTYQALSDITMVIAQGEFVGIMGPSGSGKTTLLNMVSTIDLPTSGEVLINGKNPYTLSKRQLALFRRHELGFVFQDFNLLDTLTIGENIVLPLTLDKRSVNEMDERLECVTQQLGIQDLCNKRTYEVSGGQAQRAAIARAIIHTPSLLLADEPTGNLDSKATCDIMGILERINQTQGTTTLLVTHDAFAASYCHRIIFIKDGRFYNEIRRGTNRQIFYQQIVDVLALLGGNTDDVLPIRQ
ncbi:ABC transporter ATP-binding protein YxdL [Ktedonobacter sp. SOSP1-52]|uniref:ABC transporter ATP-binding protein n=1 Tax=Ktedonobacter sp. SOSP1-52 TaxID=2778366 RepID=UPI001915BE3A|nr:ABC transporter ATP-binding protein [Ktedonobacter sp. SOSP1-52]GHO68782.1 ABC transporter ATP-binding protein YxdL [Ktedonobacter sp. SOSP1-52]